MQFLQLLKISRQDNYAHITSVGLSALFIFLFRNICEKCQVGLKKNPTIDLVLLDIKLPGMDGYEAAKQIKNQNNQTVVIAQSAYAMPEDIQRAKKSGFEDYITKPINKWDLYKAINKHLKPRPN